MSRYNRPRERVPFLHFLPPSLPHRDKTSMWAQISADVRVGGWCYEKGSFVRTDIMESWPVHLLDSAIDKSINPVHLGEIPKGAKVVG